jgi:hypothetical protein
MSEPAFPSTNAIATASGVMTQGHPGMTLRDYFAARRRIRFKSWAAALERNK